MPTNRKALIILEEIRSNHSYLPDGTSHHVNEAISKVVDLLAETTEDVITDLQVSGNYHLIWLTDVNCTRSKLLDALAEETKAGSVIDLLVRGHGNVDRLSLHGEQLTGGEGGNIRSLLADATTRDQSLDGLNLRLVYMCNCFGSTVNDDWRKVGARVSIGPTGNNYMPEPMTALFLRHWLDGMAAKEAAEASFDETIPFYAPFYKPSFYNGLHPRMKSSRPVVSGAQNCTVATPLSATTEYLVMLHTGSQPFAGTDADVFITLFGTSGATPEIELNKAGSDRKRYSVDQYRFVTRDVGRLQQARLRQSNSGMAPGWYLAHMMIQNLTSGELWQFPDPGWFAQDEPPYMVDRFLAPT